MRLIFTLLALLLPIELATPFPAPAPGPWPFDFPGRFTIAWGSMRYETRFNADGSTNCPKFGDGIWGATPNDFGGINLYLTEGSRAYMLFLDENGEGFGYSLLEWGELDCQVKAKLKRQ